MLRYIRWHHRPHEILETKPENQDKKIRLMISEVGPERVCNLMDITIADRLGQFNPMQAPVIDEVETLKERIIQLHQEEGRFTSKQLVI